ncbi:unnamed protein product, partial [Gulo gulo]
QGAGKRGSGRVPGYHTEEPGSGLGTAWSSSAPCLQCGPTHTSPSHDDLLDVASWSSTLLGWREPSLSPSSGAGEVKEVPVLPPGVCPLTFLICKYLKDSLGTP